MPAKFILIALLLLVHSSFVLSALPSETASNKVSEPELFQITGLADLATKAASKPYQPGTAARFAIKGDFPQPAVFSQGKWEALSTERLMKRIQIVSAGAENINIAFEDFFLPHGAALYLYAPDKTTVLGPWTDANNQKSRQFWSPVIPGESVVVEVVVPTKQLPFLTMELLTVNHGFMDPQTALVSKSGTCNVDVACPLANNWRDETKAESMYTLNGQDICSGTLVNNQRDDGTLYFLTANHCSINSSNAASLVFYWEYENPECRAVDSSVNGIPANRLNNTVATTQGATHIASNADTDFTLLELNEDPAPLAEVFWSGWDASNVDEWTTGIGIHHPSLDAKRISFEYDGVIVNPPPPEAFGGTALAEGYWQITDWDDGTTEGGSSGSGLWNENHQLIGQLWGGFAACSNDREDWYGRLAISWDRGSTAGTRLKDWLDPDNTGDRTLDGSTECAQPDVQIISDQNPAQVGTIVGFTAQVSGGTGPYTYAWDVDGNQTTDSTASSTPAVYSEAYSGNVSLVVTDSTGCARRTSIAQSVSAPAFNLNTANPVQACGDDDNIMEPGERWTIPVQIENTGNVAASDPVLMLSKLDALSKLAVKQAGGPDNFGYTYQDSDEAFCSYQALDIRSTGQSLNFVPSDSSYPANDDGGALVNLDGNGVSIYGKSFDQLVLSSNGYLSTLSSDNGGDYSNDCPLPALASTGGGDRIYVFHGDLVTGSAYYQYFASCPRAGEVDDQAACHVFQWNNVGLYQHGASPAGDFDIQAIIYEGSDQIVTQFVQGMSDGNTTTSGLQISSVNDALVYACDEAGSIQSQSAVCYFAPGKAPSADAASLVLETPLVQSSDIAPGQTRTFDVSIKLDSSMACGETFGLNAPAVVFDGGYASGQAGLFSSQAGGANSQCNFSGSCDTPGVPAFQPEDGLWNNAGRGGHGMDLFFVNGDTIFTAWYTAREDHSPIWYTMSAQYQDQQVHGKLYELEWDTISDSLLGTKEVGEVMLSFLDAEQAYLAWTVDGHQGAEPFNLYADTAETPAVNYSGMWYNPSESGWGITFNNKGQTNFSLIYFYDDNGQASWVLGTNQDDDGGNIPMLYFQATCPWCAVVPLSTESAGSIDLDFTSQTEGQVDTQIENPNNEYPLNWQRSNLPFFMISEPQ